MYESTQTRQRKGQLKVKSPSKNRILEDRLALATTAELNRLCGHLSITKNSSVEEIIRVYLDAADNTIFNVVRPVIPSEVPTYSQILRLIYKELRPFSEGLDESWQAVKSLTFWCYKSPIEEMEDNDLENRIFELYAAEYADARKKLIADPGLWSKVTSYLPSVTGAVAGTAATVTAATATRLPFAAVAPGLVMGPVGIAMAVVLMGVQSSGPAFRKIVPATVELMLIGRRIQYMPKE